MTTVKDMIDAAIAGLIADGLANLEVDSNTATAIQTKLNDIVSLFKDAKPKQTSAHNLEGLSEVFEVQVEGRTVRCAWIPANYFADDPNNQDVMDEIGRLNLRCPSRKVGRAAFDLKKGEMTTNPSVAIDGIPLNGPGGGKYVGCVYEHKDGRELGTSYLRFRWDRRSRFLVVISGMAPGPRALGSP